MVLCVLNQPKMELGNGGGASQTPNRKRKRKLSAPARRVIQHQYTAEEPKIIKLDDIEASRQNTQVKQISSPLPDAKNEIEPKQELDDDSLVTPLDDEIVTKVEIVEVGPAKVEDDDFDEFEGMPEILRNQAKSKRARARAAAEARLQSTSDSDSARSSSPPAQSKSSFKASTPSKSSTEDNKYYKNMSRERRLIANARERTRVHTISTAFDALRQAIPTYSYNQKLSKLAILRIASSYIKSLSAMTDDPDDLITEAVMGLDDSPVETKTQFSQCVADCTKTLQMECRARSRRKGASRKE